MVITTILVLFVLLFILIYEIKKLKRIASTEGFFKYCALGGIYCIMWSIPLYLSAFVGWSFGKIIGEIAYIIPVIILCLSVFCYYSLCSCYPKLALPTKFLFTLFIIGNIIYKFDEEVSDLKKNGEKEVKHRHNNHHRYIDALFGRRSYRSLGNNTDDIIFLELLKILDDLRNNKKH